MRAAAQANARSGPARGLPPRFDRAEGLRKGRAAAVAVRAGSRPGDRSDEEKKKAHGAAAPWAFGKIPESGLKAAYWASVFELLCFLWDFLWDFIDFVVLVEGEGETAAPLPGGLAGVAP